ncbi:MAG: hypothetical protein KGI08_07975, partial [Thaumarchaeota archaeon]|nr:hypothetical protein [Nitrososphaerota archaeon]
MTLNYSAIAPESIKDTPLPSVVAGSISLGGVNAPNESVDVSPQVIQDAQIPNDVPVSDIISAALNTQTRRILGNFTFESLGAISIGRIKISPVGILGQDTGGVTTFSLDPTTGAAYFKGTVAAGSIVTGYIAVGGAAGDVNGGSTKIQGGQIVTGSIYATQIAASAGITAGQLSVSQLSAIAANLGTITAGTINGVTIQLPNESLATGTAGKLIWASNARIWGDTSGRLGFYSAGPASDGMYFYPNATESVIFNSGGQAVFHYGIHLDNSSNLNIDGSMACNSIRLSQSAVENNITDINIIKGYNDVNLQLGNDTYYISFYNTGFTQVAYIDSSGNIHKNGTVSFDIPHPV